MSCRIVALSLFAVAGPALAQAAPVPSPTVKPEKRICRRAEETGSIMGGKSICHTKSEWASIDQRNSDNVSASRELNGHANPLGGR